MILGKEYTILTMFNCLFGLENRPRARAVLQVLEAEYGNSSRGSPWCPGGETLCFATPRSWPRAAGPTDRMSGGTPQAEGILFHKLARKLAPQRGRSNPHKAIRVHKGSPYTRS